MTRQASLTHRKRVTGGAWHPGVGWVVDYIQPVLVAVPLAWFAVNMVFWIILGGGLIVLMRRLSYLGNAVDAKKIRVNRRVHVAKLAEYMSTKTMEAMGISEEEKSTMTKYSWVENADKEKWQGIPPRFDMVVGTCGCLLPPLPPPPHSVLVLCLLRLRVYPFTLAASSTSSTAQASLVY
jgi:hypothetical protein